MAGNYEKSIYNQLVEVMARLDSVEAKTNVKYRSCMARLQS